MLVALSCCPFAGCGGGDGGGAEPGDAGSSDGGGQPARWVQIGGAPDDGLGFVDWSGGDVTPPILRGPQGGQHVWVSVRMGGLDPKKLRMAFTMFIEETGKRVIPGRVEITSTLKLEGAVGSDAGSGATAGGAAGQPGQPFYQYQGAPSFVKCPCQVFGKKLRVELEVIDLYGLTAKDEAWIVPTWDGDCDFAPVGSCKGQ